MTLLHLENLTKRFGGLIAVNDVSFDVPEGAVVGLIGPNGAGKTTVFNLITGNYRADSGKIVFDGRPINNLPTHKIVSLGIARTFQTIRLFQKLTALENVLSGCHCRMKSGSIAAMFQPPWQRAEEQKALDKALSELRFVKLAEQAMNLAENLSYGNQRLLEVARALATEPRLIILDEPAGGMNDQETARLIDTIRQIQARGVTVLLIEHDMSLVMKACEQIVVLENGGKIAEGTPSEIKANRRVIEAYLGTDEE
jgi:branched-chain amino acid transport system ATP-binding protein